MTKREPGQGDNAEAQRLAEACADSMYQQDIAAQAMGIRIDSVSPGRAVLSMSVRDDMLNGHNICHGGFTFALADTAFAYACNSYNQRAVGAGAQIDYVAPAQPGDRLTAVASECYRRGRSGIYDVLVHNQHGEQLALFRGNSRQISGAVVADAGTDDSTDNSTDYITGNSEQ